MDGFRLSPKVLAPMAVIALSLLGSESAQANINLELRPSSPSVITTFVGNTVSVGLYAVSDTPGAQFLSAVEVILNWNTTYLSLTGDSMAGSTMSAGSPRLGPDPYGFNAFLNDGDAMWVGFTPPGSPVAATASGTLLTTLNFLALAPTAPGTTPLSIPTSDVPNAGGGPGSTPTFVYDSVISNFNVLGTTTGALVLINPVPAPGALATLLLGILAVPRRRR